MKKLLICFLAFLLGASLCGCIPTGGGDDDDYDPSKDWVKFSGLDIEGARALVTWPGQVGADNVDVHKLYKLTQDAKLVEVFPLDNRGNKIDINFMPIEIYNVNDNYLLISNSNDWGGNSQGTYLVEKSNGRVTKIPRDAGFPAYHLVDRKNRGKVVQTDDSGNIYYIGNDMNDRVGERIVKLTTGAGVRHEYISKKSVKYFRVDQYGNVMYYNYLYDDHTYWLNQKEISIAEEIFHNCFTRDEELYLMTKNDEDQLKVWPVSEDGFLSDSFTPISSDSDFMKASKLDYWNPQLINIDDYIYFLRDTSLDYEIYELDSDNNLKNISGVIKGELSRIFSYDYTDSALYFVGLNTSQESTIVKYTPNSEAIEETYNLSKYNIEPPSHKHHQTIIALGNGDVLFQGTLVDNEFQYVLSIANQEGVRVVAEAPADYMDIYKDPHIVCERMGFSVTD